MKFGNRQIEAKEELALMSPPPAPATDKILPPSHYFGHQLAGVFTPIKIILPFSGPYSNHMNVNKNG